MPPTLSVIVLNWNARHYLVPCLHSLQKQACRFDFEMIVVDNASQLDDSVAVVERDFPNVTLIKNAQNLGFAGGNNVGLRASSGRYALFLNPDTVVHQGALQTLVDWMESHPKAGACGPMLLNSDGSLQTSCRGFPSLGVGFFRNTPLGRLFPNNPWTRSYLMQDFQHDMPAKVDWLSGAALLLRREALNQIGAWDEGYFMYCEDVDLCYRLSQANWERWYVPESVITHRIGASSDWAQGAMIRQHHGSMLRFYWKNKSHGWGMLAAPIVTLGIGVRALGAVLKLYRRYLEAGRLAQMWRNRFGE